MFPNDTTIADDYKTEKPDKVKLKRRIENNVIGRKNRIQDFDSNNEPSKRHRLKKDKKKN
jgi:hypothetical protein